ncbi:MAG: MYXO-CTERM domain-containing protein, partial [Bradymonadia bacterium]
DLDDDNHGILDCGLDGFCLHDRDGVGNVDNWQDTIDLLRGEGLLPDDGVDKAGDGAGGWWLLAMLGVIARRRVS